MDEFTWTLTGIACTGVLALWFGALWASDSKHPERDSWAKQLRMRVRWWIACNRPARRMPTLPRSREPVRPQMRVVGKIEPRGRP